MLEYEKSFWDKRYASGGNSGDGSYGEQLKKKLEWIAPLDFETVTEVGCGDFNFGKNLLELHPARYIGMDTSDLIIERNKVLYPEHLFIKKHRIVPQADLVLCIDVLFHVIEYKDLEELLEDLRRAWTKYLIVTAYERYEEKSNHLRIRKFDYKQFGEPIFRQIIEEDGELYFYIFKK